MTEMEELKIEYMETKKTLRQYKKDLRNAKRQLRWKYVVTDAVAEIDYRV